LEAEPSCCPKVAKWDYSRQRRSARDARFLSHRGVECQSTTRKALNPRYAAVMELILQLFSAKQRQLASDFAPRRRPDPYKRNRTGIADDRASRTMELTSV
jgi:hypothetical protein